MHTPNLLSIQVLRRWGRRTDTLEGSRLTYLEGIATTAALVVARILGLNDESHLQPKHALHPRQLH